MITSLKQGWRVFHLKAKLLIFLFILSVLVSSSVSAEREGSVDYDDYYFIHFANGTTKTDMAGGKGTEIGGNANSFTAHGDYYTVTDDGGAANGFGYIANSSITSGNVTVEFDFKVTGETFYQSLGSVDSVSDFDALASHNAACLLRFEPANVQRWDGGSWSIVCTIDTGIFLTYVIVYDIDADDCSYAVYNSTSGELLPGCSDIKVTNHDTQTSINASGLTQLGAGDGGSMDNMTIYAGNGILDGRPQAPPDTTPPTLSDVTLLSTVTGREDENVTLTDTPTFYVNAVDDEGSVEMIRCSNDSTLTFDTAGETRNGTYVSGTNWTCTLSSADKLTNYGVLQPIYFWGLDDSGNNHTTPNATMNVTLIETDAPSFSNQVKNETPSINEYLRMNVTITDANPLNYSFFWNDSGTLENITNGSYTSGETISVTKQVTTAHQNICWGYWANDTNGNSNSSDLSCFTVANTAPTQGTPTINSSLGTNLTTETLQCFNVSTADVDGDLVTNSYRWFEDTVLIGGETSSTLANTNTEKDKDYICEIAITDGTDSGTSANSTSLTILNTAPTTPNVTYPVNNTNYISIPYINYSSTDADGDNINYSIYINGTLNITTSVNVTDWNASDGFYNLTVTANDGTVSSANSSVVHFRLDSTLPSWSNNETNATLMKLNGNATFNITVLDYGSGLSYYIFSWNGTGVWDNATNGSISGSSVKLVINKSTTLSKGNIIGYMWHANDSANNWNNSLLRTFTVANTAPTPPQIIFPVDGKNYTNITAINYSSGDVDGDSLTYNIYINNTLNSTLVDANLTDWNASDGFYNLTVTANDGTVSSANSSVVHFRLDSTLPSWSNNETNATLMKLNGNATFNITVLDYGSGLSYYIFSWNGTGVWDNATNGSISGSSVKLVINKSTTLSKGNIIGYMWHANDSANNWNNSLLRTFTVANTEITFSNAINGSLNFRKDENLTANITINDADGDLSSYIFSHNNSGIWNNDSLVSISGTTYRANSSFNISKSQGNYICWKYYANDTANSIQASNEYCFTVANTAPTTPIIYFPVDGKNYSNIAYITYSSTDVDGDSLTYNIYINNTLNATLVDANLTDWNASDGYYNLTVTTCDDTDCSANSSVVHFRLSPFFIDDCSSYDTLLLNYTLYDEDTLIKISNKSEYIKVNIDVYASGNTTPILEYYKKFNGNNATICISQELINPEQEPYTLYVIAEYDTDDHVHEFDYIQNMVLDFSSNIPRDIKLYDLLDSRSQSFLITFKDNVFLPVDGAIIEIMRFYTDQGEYISVEDSLTNEHGQTIGHFVEEDALYSFITKKEGVILATFDDILALCPELPCQINLNQFESITEIGDFDYQVPNLAYTYDFNKSERNITVLFSVLDSSSATLELTATVYDNFGDSSPCSDSITSSSGVLVCEIPVIFGNVTVESKLEKDGEFVTRRYHSLKPSSFSIFGYTGYFMAALMYILLPFMAITSPIGAIILSIIGLVFGGMLGLIATSKLFAIGSSLIWFVIAGIILIWKIHKRE